MANTLLNYFVGGAGFMTGILVVYTIYDFITTRIAAHREARANKNRRRRRK